MEIFDIDTLTKDSSGNYNLNQTTFTISESIVYFTTQSNILTGSTIAGGIYFTSSSFYVGLEN